MAKFDHAPQCISVNMEKEEVIRIGNYSPSGHSATSIVSTAGATPAVMENHGQVTAIPIKNATKDGYLLAEDGDGVNISSRMEYQRGNVQKGMCQTLNTSGQGGVVVMDQENKNKGITITKNFVQWHQDGHFDVECRAWFEDGVSPTTTTPKQHILQSDLRIRKLTPLECFRLMGVKDEDSKKIQQSDSSKYHLAGDSIVTTCLMALFGELLDIDYKSKIRELVEEIKNGNK